MRTFSGHTVSEGQCHTGTGSQISEKIHRWIYLTERWSKMTPGANPPLITAKNKSQS